MGGSSCRTSPRAEFLQSEASSSGEHFKKPFCAFARLFSCLRNIRLFTKGMRVRKGSEKNRCVLVCACARVCVGLTQEDRAWGLGAVLTAPRLLYRGSWPNSRLIS